MVIKKQKVRRKDLFGVTETTFVQTRSGIFKAISAKRVKKRR
ncbi:hypothetical protein LCGC14_1584180 [marine sediment metagenome]|uniref:Uncharacterized protein n=1 Tax=marine sediment metagenome TaxID=412755 RepID=A0A0F9IG31_9ZZZZ